MTSLIRRVGGVVVAALIAVGHRSDAGEIPKAPPVSAATNTPVGVDALMQGIDRYHGALRVEGVVSAVSVEENVLGLIDLSELEKCGRTTCARFTLPIRWAGAMPAVGDVVRVEGEVTKANGKLVFVARTLEPSKAPAKGTR